MAIWTLLFTVHPADPSPWPRTRLKCHFSWDVFNESEWMGPVLYNSPHSQSFSLTAGVCSTSSSLHITLPWGRTYPQSYPWQISAAFVIFFSVLSMTHTQNCNEGVHTHQIMDTGDSWTCSGLDGSSPHLLHRPHAVPSTHNHPQSIQIEHRGLSGFLFIRCLKWMKDVV